ncbi:hypothetical protein DL96DRAFT_1717543 [Flagelloscypha sp. PMI_526]|nr:hypothetical protein DL96DRAFT_1717543 [Flagelloscypha sp. PMI_526]
MPATTQLPGQQLPLDDTMGVMFLGTLLSAVFLARRLFKQSTTMFNTLKTSQYGSGSLVFMVVFMDTMHMASISLVYHYLITHYYDKTALTRLVWSIVVEAIFNGITAGLVQAFYAHRVWLLTAGNKWMVFLILLLIVATAGSGTAWAVLGLQMDTYHDLLKLTPLTITINVLSATTDVLIAGSLIYNLLSSRTGFKQTNTVITKLIVFFINTGLATSVFALGSTIALAIRPDTLVYALFYFCIGRLYVNSLLASLNARKSLRNTSASRPEPDHSLVSFPVSPASTNAMRLQDGTNWKETSRGLQVVAHSQADLHGASEQKSPL